MAQPAKQISAIGFALLGLAGLYISSVYSYLLFHTLAEFFSIVIACGMFMVAWNSRRFMDNHYLLFMGIAYLFVGGLDLVHTLSFKGMRIFGEGDTNTATQFWIAARYMESLSLLISPFMLNRRLHSGGLIAGYAAATLLVILSVFYWKIFPDCFLDGSGLTPFKKISEYIISMILLAAAVLLYRHRRDQDRVVLRWILVSIALTIASEIAFTEYYQAYGVANLIGHYLKILSYYFIYRAIIQTGLNRPYSVLFLQLKRSEQSLLRIRRRLEDKVRERTADLQATVNALSAEVNKRLKAESMLRELSRKTIEALENDRKLVAAELHDGIGGSLAAIKYLLEEVLFKLDKGVAVQARQIEKVVSYLLDTIKEAKHIAARLRPPTLEGLGLLATIQAVTRRFSDLYKDIRLDLRIEVREEDVPDHLKIVIYRVLQEVLNNVGKHSQASRVSICLRTHHDRIEFELADDGIGFDTGRQDPSESDLSGYGLQGMRDRAQLMGGNLAVISAPNEGTRILVEFPIDPSR